MPYLFSSFYLLCLRLLLLFLGLFNQIKHFFAAIKTTGAADGVRLLERSAVLTLGETALFERMVRTAISRVRPRMSHSYYHNWL